MATLKEIAPMILAGLAGAGSPQGAQVFQGIADQARQRKLDARREEESEFRRERALEASERAERGEKRDIERHKGSVAVSELRRRKYERELAEDERTERGRQQYITSSMEANAEMFADEPGRAIMFQEAKDIDEADDMLKEWNAPTLKDLAKKHKEADEAGMRIQTDRYGNIVSAWAAQDSDGSKQIHKANQILVKALGQQRELQADYEEARDDYQNALRILKSGASGDDEMAIKRYEQANEDVKDASNQMRRLRGQMDRNALNVQGDVSFATGNDDAGMQAAQIVRGQTGLPQQGQEQPPGPPPDAPDPTEDYDALYAEKN